MSATEPATLLRIHICEADKFGDTALYEALVRTCRDFGIAGATVFRGIEGYGETAEIHRKHIVTADRPVVVVIVDSEENIARVLPALEDMVDTGMIATSTVDMRRVRNKER
jgi:PII-like signaling protein